MTNHSPITPPPELVEKWRTQRPEFADSGVTSVVSMTQSRLRDIATQAANWGSDQELEACLVEVSFFGSRVLADKIRAARRPKPPSLKEQALDELTSAERLYPADWSTIRHALEALDD
tara:strand:- start:406 stop:759 length:354 start_codon:yes stop_codon:yes gene_type:complete